MYNDSFDGLDSQKKICNYASSVLELELRCMRLKQFLKNCCMKL